MNGEWRSGVSDDRGADDAASSPDRQQSSGDDAAREASAPASAAARRERRGGATRSAGTGTSTAAAGRRPAGSDGATGSALSRVLRFLREVAAELRKVIWPTRPQLVNYTVVVLVFLAVMVTFVALLDLGFGNLMFYVFGD
jgi:preprotein translocase subunit SecE